MWNSVADPGRSNGRVVASAPHGTETAFWGAGVASPTSSGCERGHFYPWPYALYTLAELVLRRDCGDKSLRVNDLGTV